jgi:hypothetical protein
VHAAADRPADGEAQRALRDRAVLGEQRTVGEKDAGRVIAYGTAVDALRSSLDASDDAAVPRVRRWQRWPSC